MLTRILCYSGQLVSLLSSEGYRLGSRVALTAVCFRLDVWA